MCRVCIKTVGLPAGNQYPEKVMELFVEKTQLTGSSNDLPF